MLGTKRDTKCPFEEILTRKQQQQGILYSHDTDKLAFFQQQQGILYSHDTDFLINFFCLKKIGYERVQRLRISCIPKKSFDVKKKQEGIGIPSHDKGYVSFARIPYLFEGTLTLFFSRDTYPFFFCAIIV